MPIIGSSASQSGRIPGVPTITGVTAGNASVSVAFTEPAYKGKGTVTYTATSSPGGFTGTASSSPITVSGLTNGTAYTFTVRANGASGVASSASAASSSATPVIPFTATGGSTITSGGYKYHVFTSNGTFQVTNGSTSSGEVISIAGGGPGFRGGGGAGGLVYASGRTFTVGNYTTVVGGAGSNSTFTGLTNAIAGGQGGLDLSRPPAVGGSGGGAFNELFNSQNGAAGTAGQGNAGGNSAPGLSSSGGGGAGGSGGGGDGNNGGAGGSGSNAYSTWLTAIASLMTGVANWGTATSTGHIAGGGGGYAYVTRGVGGAGGGGAGGTGSSGGNLAPITGSTNTGSGGGGWGSGGTEEQIRISGGSGIVIVRYAV
jgi:hypothetical protein